MTAANAHDVAKYILRTKGAVNTWKLQKLVYYCQAWHAVWDSEPLFKERIEAWANGPVVPDLYRQHRGQFTVSTWPAGKITNLTPSQRESIDAVIAYYGRRTGMWLRELAHREPPWREAREGREPGERGNTPITIGAMTDYYGSL